MPFRQRDRRPGRDRRSGSYVRASGTTIPSPGISVDGSRVLLTFTSSNPSFSFLGVDGSVHQKSETFIKTTDVSPDLKGAAKIDSRQKGSVFSLVPTYGAIPSAATAIIKNASSLRRGVVGGGGNGQNGGWSGGGGGGAAYSYDPSATTFNFAHKNNQLFLDYKFAGSATVASASGTSSLQVTDAFGTSTDLSAPGGAAGANNHPTGSGGGGGVITIGPAGASTVGAGSGGPSGNNGASAVGWPGCGTLPSAASYGGGGGGAAGASTGQNGGAALNIYPLFGEPGTYSIGGGGGGGGWGPGVPYGYGDGYGGCPGRPKGTNSGAGPSGGSGGTNAGPGRTSATANYGGGGGGGGNGGTGAPQTAGTGGSGVCFLRIA